jgi:Flp pilus assembly secretin CpaC
MLLQALKSEGLAKLVAEPKLVTQSGRPARFLSGGQATLSATSGINGPGVTYEDIGTELEFLPIVTATARSTSKWAASWRQSGPWRDDHFRHGARLR